MAEKTEFDFTCSDEKALDEVMETWLPPEKYRLDGDRLKTRKIVDGSVIKVGAYGVNGQYNNYAEGYPVAGCEFTRIQKR